MAVDGGKVINIIEKVFAYPEFPVVRAAFIAAARRESGRVQDDAAWLRGRGFEPVDAQSGQLLTTDGREVLRLHGDAWALRPEVHARRMAEAVERSKRLGALRKQVDQGAAVAQPATCTALIDGQLCGGTLVNVPVCPRCALGKSGVAATLTCDVCGHVTAIMREAK